MEKPKKSNINLWIVSISIVVIFVLAFSGMKLKDNNKLQGAAVTGPKMSLSDLEDNIYPKFICSCCGKTIDQCSCGMAAEMKQYINSLAANGLSEKEITITAAKKYGLTSLASVSLQEEIKKEIIKSAPKDRPKIVIEPSSYDFGDISQAKGIIDAFFIIRNEGKGDLIIDNIDTSCMCTTASIISNEIEGPIFGMSMHGTNPKNWQTLIKPGESAKLKVYYDPDAHGEFRGLVTRTVTISSNDPIDFQKQVRIDLNQIP